MKKTIIEAAAAEKPKPPATVANDGAAATEPDAGDLDLSEFGRFAYLQGQAETPHHLCNAIRECLFPILAGMNLPGDASEDRGLRLRVGLAALVDYLMVGWCEEPLIAGREQGFIGKLPAIKFRMFGPYAKKAMAHFEALQTFWKSEPASETEDMWPADFIREWPADSPAAADGAGNGSRGSEYVKH